MDEEKVDQLAKVLSKQIDRAAFAKKYAPAKDVLLLVGAGIFLAGAIAMPNLPLTLKPFLKDRDGYEAWKRFNIPHLKRTIQRLERQKLVTIAEKDEKQVIKITEAGREKIFKYSLDTLEIKKPNVWDRKWRLVSFDLPEKQAKKRKAFVEYLHLWKFYPLHKSVYLHAYPCLNEINFLREYLGIHEYVRLFIVSKIENDNEFREFFDL